MLRHIQYSYNLADQFSSWTEVVSCKRVPKKLRIEGTYKPKPSSNKKIKKEENLKNIQKAKKADLN